MLGLGSSCNSEEGYAKGERYRERFHTGGTYYVLTNPMGRVGSEDDYIGDWSDADTDADNWTFTDCAGGISGGVMRIQENGSGTYGYMSIVVSTVPNVQYTLSALFDPGSAANGTGQIKAGINNGVGVGSYADSGTFNTSNTTETLNFTSTAELAYISFFVNGNAKRTFYDNISFKES